MFNLGLLVQLAPYWERIHEAMGLVREIQADPASAAAFALVQKYEADPRLKDAVLLAEELSKVLAEAQKPS